MNERNMVTKMQCERDRDEHGTLREGGCEAEATEAVESIDGDEHRMCAAHAIEARRLNGVLHKIVAGDPEGQRLQKWLGEAGDRAEYDRRVATLPEVH